MWLSLSNALILISILSSYHAVDRNNFKSCSQSGFCKRHRDFKQADKVNYIALLNTAQFDEAKFSIQILNTQESVYLKAELLFLKDNSMRFKVDELNALKKRYEVVDSLVGDLKVAGISLVKKTHDSIEMKSDDNQLRVIIHASPFKLEAYSNDQLLVTFNSRNFFKFEHLRTKTTSSNEGETNKTEAIEEPDMWEETYKTHTDSKPNGPESVGLDVTFHNFEHVYGIPEHADSFALRSTSNTDPYRLFNLDVFEYEINSPMALYGSIPYMLAHNEQTTMGLLWLNAAETWIDVRPSLAEKSIFSKVSEFITKSNEIPQVDTHWVSEAGIIDVFVMFGPRPNDVFRQYGQLTGNTPLPPLFAIAYHQCRWNYNDDHDVRNVNAGFEEHEIPYDVLWLDIEHTDGKKYFTWDSIKFPNPEETLNHISSYGRKMVTIVDPHIKVDQSYKIYSEAKEQGFFIKNKDGHDMEGWCWPGQSSWLDYLNNDVRKWYASKFAFEEYKGSTHDLYTWNDMNEMSVFSGPEVTCPKDTLHHGGWENRHVHNLYGMLQALATYDGHLMRSDGKRRPFILSRAFFVGSQRAGAIWTGDNTAEWSHLKISTPMLLSLSVTGIAHCGADVGGFFKNPDPELLVRWYQAGAYQPFFRAHAHIDTKRREPWLFDEQTKFLIKEAIHARYALLYYWYTLFHQTESSGVSPMLPLWANFPHEKDNFAMDDEYMIGQALLVKPITDAGVTSISVHFPGKGEIWYDLKTHKVYKGYTTETISDVTLSTIPVFHRGGHIIPYKFRSRRSSAQMNNDPFTLVVPLNRNKTACGELYFDDGLTFDYKSGKKFVHRQFTYEHKTLKSINLHPESSLETTAWLERVIMYGFHYKPNSIIIKSDDGTTSQLSFSYDPNTQVLLIRKPGIVMNKDWIITIN